MGLLIYNMISNANVMPMMTSFVLHYRALIAGNSHPSGPNFGIVMRTPTLFFIGFENVHSVSFPRVDSQAGLITVRPADIV